MTPQRSRAQHGLLAKCSLLVLAGALSACGTRDIAPLHRPKFEFPAGFTSGPMITADFVSGGPCTVSSDGFIWYTLPAGTIPPFDFTQARCASPADIDARALPQIPLWAKPLGTTKAIFAATSLQQAYSLTGMQAIERDAEGVGVPITWMIGNLTYITQNSAYYNQLHAANGDDVELANDPALYAAAGQQFPWFVPAVSVEGAGHERNISGAIALGNEAFWGITWNSHGTDNTSDEGAPWGSYCADPTSYKRPAPSACTLLAFEWTARDLTRAYLSNTNADGYSAEAAFSTDPDDVLLRGGFDETTGPAYVRALVDAYAAAGANQPLVMISQQESIDEGTRTAQDDPLLQALYQQAKQDGMQAMTLRQAAVAAATFSANARAVAFPYVSGGRLTTYNAAPFAPATIDYHDDAAGMTFISGHTLPARVFEYLQDPVSTFNLPLVVTLPGDPGYPQLLAVSESAGRLSLSFAAATATHFGIAIWSDPTALGVTGPNIVAAGHAGFVATFDLPSGMSMQSIACGSCTSTTFAFSR